MATTTAIFLLVVAVSNVYSQNRLAHHFFFQSMKDITTANPPPTTTPQTTAAPPRVEVVDKMPGSNFVFPNNSNKQSIVDLLTNRQFSWWQNRGAGIGDKNIVQSTQAPTKSEAYAASPITDSRSSAPDTTVTPTTTTTSTSTTTASSTTTTTVSIDGEKTTKYKNYFFNEDGSVNKDRPDMLYNSGQAQPQTKDRNSLFLNFIRPPVHASNSRSRSSDLGGALPLATTTRGSTARVEITTTTSTSPRPNIGSGNNNNNNRYYGGIEIGPNGAVYIVNNRHTTTTTTTTTPVYIPDDRRAPGELDVQDKPFYGDNQRLRFTDGNSTVGRRKRQASGQQSNGTLTFETCEYYIQIFQKLSSACKSRETFLGYSASRFCESIRSTVASTRSQMLKTYLNNVLKSVRERLESQTNETSTCDEVTLTISDALLQKNMSSCLYQGGQLCKVIDNPEARPELARLLNKATVDVSFMSRILINIGSMAYNCKEGGSSVFIYDLVVLASTKDSPLNSRFSSSPIQRIQPKF